MGDRVDHAVHSRLAHGLRSTAVDVERQAVVAMDQPDSLRSGDSGHGGMDMGIAVMCVAILGAAVLALLQFLRRERPSSVIWTRPYWPRVLMRLGGGPTPPSSLACRSSAANGRRSAAWWLRWFRLP